jgi:hypothetical protein
MTQTATTQTPTFERRPYQARIIDQCGELYAGGEINSVMIESPTGCLVGDTVIQINLGGNSRKITMREAYLHFHSGDPNAKPDECGCGCGEQTRVPAKGDASKGQIKGVPLKFNHGHHTICSSWNTSVKVRSYKGGDGIGLQPVLDIVQSGVKEVFKLVLDNGMHLVGTKCHPILTGRGWVPMGELTGDDLIFVDKLSPQKSDGPRSKPRDRHVWNLWNHPFGRRVVSKKESRGYSIRVPMHVAVAEANLNGLSFDDYVEIVRNGDPNGLQFIDPTVFVVHHKDSDHSNNSVDNLEIMTVLEHNTMHGKKDWFKNFGNFMPGVAKMESFEYVGEQMTYDICCEQPYHNFVANGIIVHNSGKSFMGLQVAQELHDKLDGELIVVWVAMRRNLLNQIRREIVKFGITADVRPLSMFDKHIRYGIAAEAKESGKTVLVVLDEAHHDAATSMTDLHKILDPDYVLGLSATPYRVDKAQLCFQKQIRDAGIHRLIFDGYLSKYDLHIIEEWTPESVVAAYLEDPVKWGKSVFYFLDTTQAARCQQLLVAAGVKSHLVLGSESEKVKEQQLEDFENNTVDCLVNCMILTEGFDCPSLKTAWVRDSSRGPTIQMAGRTFRIHPDLPRKNIVQSKHTKWTISRTAPPEDQYVLNEGVWTNPKPNKRLAEISQMATTIAVQNWQPLPDFIAKKQKKVKRNRV